MCEMCLSKLSSQELHRDMNSDNSVGWKLFNSLLRHSNAAQRFCLIQALFSGWGGSLPHLSFFVFSFSLSILLIVVSLTLLSFSHSLTPSLSPLSTECHRISFWSVSDRSGLLPLCRPAPHYSWQHRACFSVWKDSLQVLQVSLKLLI